MIDKMIRWQKQIRLTIGYRFLGNLAANLHSQPYFDYLKDKIPQEFLGKDISDLGCGDGYATKKIEVLFSPRSIKGYEINKYLVRRAQNKGIQAEQWDLEKDVPQGEMAIIWGVLHHLGNKEAVLKKINSNFNYTVFMEPIKSYWSFLDGGYPLPEIELKNLFGKILGGAKFLVFKDSLFVFWKKI